MYKILLTCLIMASEVVSAGSNIKKKKNTRPDGVKEIQYVSSIDKTEQPSLIYTAKSKDKRPLLVGLHSWSINYR
ncbi:MAG: hypothetical protein MK132_11060 [Lentisphaerales bacterium]|nr:hypothetical protein [Lentisphaerales bacterium]